MTPEKRIGRRLFLGVSTAGLVILLRATRGPIADASAVATRAANQRSDGVVRLGNAYLRVAPREADRNFLLARLPGIDRSASLRPQLPALQPRIVRDFESGRVVTVQGWQLARTEARAAAAIALGA